MQYRKSHRMKRIKMIIVYSIIIFPIKSFGWDLFGGVARDAAQFASQAGIEMTQIAAEAAPTIGADGATALADAIKFASVAGLVATKVASVAVIQSTIIVVGAAGGCYLLYKLVDAGANLYTYNYPDQEKQTRLKKAEEEGAVIKAKQAFKDCLMQHAKGPKNSEGLPVNCQECGRVFAMAAGNAEFRTMAETFKAVY